MKKILTKKILIDEKEVEISQLTQIKEAKKVCFSYLSPVRRIPYPGIKGILGKTRPFQEVKEAVIKDESGMRLSLDGEALSLRFSNKKAYRNIGEYDPDTLQKSLVSRIFRPYRVLVPVGNLIEIRT